LLFILLQAKLYPSSKQHFNHNIILSVNLAKIFWILSPNIGEDGLAPCLDSNEIYGKKSSPEIKMKTPTILCRDLFEFMQISSGIDINKPVLLVIGYYFIKAHLDGFESDEKTV